MVSAASICHSLVALPTPAPQGEDTIWRVAPPALCTKARSSPRRSRVVLPTLSTVLKGAPMIVSLLRSSWKPVSMSQVWGLLRSIRGEEDCQAQELSRVQRWIWRVGL